MASDGVVSKSGDDAAPGRILALYTAISPKLGEVVDEFCRRLFAGNPSLRAMFPKDMTKAKSHLAAALGVVAKNAGSIKNLEKPLMETGSRHAVHGARPEHYTFALDAMLAAMQEVAGSAFTKRLHDDWRSCLGQVAEMLIKGVRAAERQGSTMRKAA